MSEENLVQVGDVVIVKNVFGTSRYPVTRITKTLAISKRETDGFEQKFKRQISHDMCHPYRQWNTNQYSVIRKK